VGQKIGGDSLSLKKTTSTQRKIFASCYIASSKLLLNLLCTHLLCYFYYDIDLYEDSSPKPLYIYFTTQHKGQYTKLTRTLIAVFQNAGYKTSQLDFRRVKESFLSSNCILTSQNDIPF